MRMRVNLSYHFYCMTNVADDLQLSLGLTYFRNDESTKLISNL
jgi:hypothetical protein